MIGKQTAKTRCAICNGYIAGRKRIYSIHLNGWRHRDSSKCDPSLHLEYKSLFSGDKLERARKMREFRLKLLKNKIRGLSI